MKQKEYFLYDYLSTFDSSRVVSSCFHNGVYLKQKSYIFDSRQKQVKHKPMKWTITLAQLDKCIDKVKDRSLVDPRRMQILKLLKQLKALLVSENDVYRQIRNESLPKGK